MTVKKKDSKTAKSQKSAKNEAKFTKENSNKRNSDANLNLNVSVSGKALKVILAIFCIFMGFKVLFGSSQNKIELKDNQGELAVEVIDGNASEILDENEGKLINVHGKVYLDNPIEDPYTHYRVDSAIADRTIEMYQWDKKCDDDGKNCKYEKVWSSRLIDSTDFDKEHQNPKTEAPLGVTRLYNDSAKLGKFTLSFEVLRDIGVTGRDQTLDQSLVADFHRKDISGNKYLADFHGDAKIGAIRVSYFTKNFERMSVLGMQKESTLMPYYAGKDNDVMVFASLEGEHSKEDLIAEIGSAKHVSNFLMWIVGGLFMLLGITSLLDLLGFKGLKFGKK